MKTANITANGYHLPTLARIARESNRPEQGPIAVILWTLSNNLPAPLAQDLMADAGYECWVGYPLMRASA
jgi:hypothetical protein